MDSKAKIKALFEEADGTVTAGQLAIAGLHGNELQELVTRGELHRVGRGLYVLGTAWEDDFFLLQQRYSRGIYSHETALYLQGMTENAPENCTMTFPKGYNAPSLKTENVIIKRVVPENYAPGIVEIPSPCGNPLRVYDIERTLCDIVRGSGSDIQTVNAAMRKYAASKSRDIHKLMQYAEQLRVKPKIQRYMEILFV